MARPITCLSLLLGLLVPGLLAKDAGIGYRTGAKLSVIEPRQESKQAPKKKHVYPHAVVTYNNTNGHHEEPSVELYCHYTYAKKGGNLMYRVEAVNHGIEFPEFCNTLEYIILNTCRMNNGILVGKRPHGALRGCDPQTLDSLGRPSYKAVMEFYVDSNNLQGIKGIKNNNGQAECMANAIEAATDFVKAEWQLPPARCIFVNLKYPPIVGGERRGGEVLENHTPSEKVEEHHSPPLPADSFS
ncbi:hypothetical protein G7046_g173 [Stylonectria norvegica]|nr:hypothetical protein G7046_g173 [Stylonectria norvegica]